MKQIVGLQAGAYAFAPLTNQVTISGYPGLVLEQILSITNVTSNAPIFNPFDNTKTATLANNASGSVTLTLAYNTTAMNSTDHLQIILEVPDALLVGTDGPLPVSGIDSTGTPHTLRTDTTGAVAIAGQQQVGGATPAGSVPTAAPVLGGGVDPTGITRQIATEPSGAQQASLYGKTAQGVLVPLLTDSLGRVIMRLPETAGDNDSLLEILANILKQMRLTNFLLQQGFGISDEASSFLEDPSQITVQS